MGVAQVGTAPAARTARTVLLVLHQTLIREALACALERGGFAVVGQAGDSAAALDALRRVEPGLLLVDLGLADRSAPDLVRHVRRSAPATRVVVLTDGARERLAHAALLAGVDGHLSRNEPLAQLLQTLRRVRDESRGRAGGESGQSGRRRLLALAAPPVRCTPPLALREREVAELVAAGKTNREIAAALCLSPHTVRHYLENVMDKLGVHRRAEVAAILGRNRSGEEGTFIPTLRPRRYASLGV